MDKLRKYEDLIRLVFNTPDGQELAEWLKYLYCDGSVVTADTHKTYFLLGKKELIEEILRLSKEPPKEDSNV